MHLLGSFVDNVCIARLFVRPLPRDCPPLDVPNGVEYRDIPQERGGGRGGPLSLPLLGFGFWALDSGLWIDASTCGCMAIMQRTKKRTGIRTYKHVVRAMHSDANTLHRVKQVCVTIHISPPFPFLEEGGVASRAFFSDCHHHASFAVVRPIAVVSLGVARDECGTLRHFVANVEVARKHRVGDARCDGLVKVPTPGIVAKRFVSPEGCEGRVTIVASYALHDAAQSTVVCDVYQCMDRRVLLCRGPQSTRQCGIPGYASICGCHDASAAPLLLTRHVSGVLLSHLSEREGRHAFIKVPPEGDEYLLAPLNALDYPNTIVR